MKKLIHPTELDAACKAYWEHGGDNADLPWESLPEHGKRNVRARIAAALAVVGVIAPKPVVAGATPPR